MNDCLICPKCGMKTKDLDRHAFYGALYEGKECGKYKRVEKKK